MLEANKNRLFEAIFAVYNRNLLRRHFESLKVTGLNYLEAAGSDFPLIIFPNHSAWWDGLVAFEISRAAGLDAYVMMEEKQLRKLFPFRYLGAFSVVREKPREAVRSLNYASRLLLDDAGRTLWIFPQGEILPNDVRPLRFYQGLRRIVEKVGRCRVASLAIRYEFLGEFKPQIFVKIGKPEMLPADAAVTGEDLTSALAARLTADLDALKSDIVNVRTADYRRIV
jgi:chlorobactene lauroyltransferase